MADEEQQSIDQITKESDELEADGFASEALARWREAARQFETPYLFYRLGRLAMDMEEWKESEDALLQALELAPEFPGPYDTLGLLSLELGDYEAAQQYFRSRLALEEDSGTYTLLGLAQNDLGMIRAARWSYGKAIELDRAYEEAYYNLAMTFRI